MDMLITLPWYNIYSRVMQAVFPILFSVFPKEDKKVCKRKLQLAGILIGRTTASDSSSWIGGPSAAIPS